MAAASGHNNTYSQAPHVDRTYPSQLPVPSALPALCSNAQRVDAPSATLHYQYINTCHVQQCVHSQQLSSRTGESSRAEGHPLLPELDHGCCYWYMNRDMCNRTPTRPTKSFIVRSPSRTHTQCNQYNIPLHSSAARADHAHKNTTPKYGHDCRSHLSIGSPTSTGRTYNTTLCKVLSAAGPVRTMPCLVICHRPCTTSKLLASAAQEQGDGAYWYS